MSTITPQTETPPSPGPPAPASNVVTFTTEMRRPNPPHNLIDNDGVPLESDWHRLEIGLLIDSLDWRLRHRKDYFIGGNMFIYYSEAQARNLDYRGPDFFYVDGVDRDKRRRFWTVWEEDGRYPDVIVELGSPTTIQVDRTVKKEIYEQKFRTREYFIYDPDQDRLEGFGFNGNRYQPKTPNDKGWLRCDELDLWLGFWEGTYQRKRYVYLRWFDNDGNLVPTAEEAERQRADAAEAEIARLKALLQQQQPPTP